MSTCTELFHIKLLLHVHFHGFESRTNFRFLFFKSHLLCVSTFLSRASVRDFQACCPACPCAYGTPSSKNALTAHTPSSLPFS